MIGLALALAVGCDSGGNRPQPNGPQGHAAPTPKFSVSYKPPFVPITISINSQGELSIKGEAAIRTPLGTFTFEAEYPLNPQPEYTRVIVQDRRPGKSSAYYDILTGDRPLVIAIEGADTRISIEDRRIVIDITDGVPRTFQLMEPGTSEELAKQLEAAHQQNKKLQQELDGLRKKLQTPKRPVLQPLPMSEHLVRVSYRPRSYGFNIADNDEKRQIDRAIEKYGIRLIKNTPYVTIQGIVAGKHVKQFRYDFDTTPIERLMTAEEADLVQREIGSWCYIVRDTKK